MPFQKGNKLGRKFEPGRSANPGGRPKKLPLTSALEKLSDEACPVELLFTEDLRARLGLTSKKKYTYAEVAARLLFQGLITGKAGTATSFKEWADRIEGKVVERVEKAGADSGPLDIKKTLEICERPWGSRHTSDERMKPLDLYPHQWQRGRRRFPPENSDEGVAHRATRSGAGADERFANAREAKAASRLSSGMLTRSFTRLP